MDVCPGTPSEPKQAYRNCKGADACRRKCKFGRDFSLLVEFIYVASDVSAKSKKADFKGNECLLCRGPILGILHIDSMSVYPVKHIRVNSTHFRVFLIPPDHDHVVGAFLGINLLPGDTLEPLSVLLPRALRDILDLQFVGLICCAASASRNRTTAVT